MKITIAGILRETPFTLGIWAARLKLCQGIISNFSDQMIQDIIDFKGKRNTSDFDETGYANTVHRVWEQYCEIDFNSAYWGQENLKFTSDFILKAASAFKKCRLELKKKKIIELKNDIASLQKELDNGVD